MKKVFALTLACTVCLGCQAGGQRKPGSAFSSTTPAASSAPATSAVAGDAGTNQTNGTGASSVMASAAGTLGKIWNVVSFQQPAPAEPAPVSPEMARFNSFVGAISAQTSQLNVNDPPEVTRQKAEGILTTLRDWDSVLAAGRSIGVINDATANLLTNSVQRLTAETQKLVQFAPRPETIDAVKQIGGGLSAAYSSVQGILAQGSTVSQGLVGGSPQ